MIPYARDFRKVGILEHLKFREKMLCLQLSAFFWDAGLEQRGENDTQFKQIFLVLFL